MLAFQSDNDSDVHLTVERDGEQVEIQIRDASNQESQYVYLAATDIGPLIDLLRETAQDAEAASE